MASTGLLLLASVVILVNMHQSRGVSLSPYGRNVRTLYTAYYVPEGRSYKIYYYVRTCTTTCTFFCWGRRRVCSNRQKSKWKTVYTYVRRTRKIYRCSYGWKQSGSSCTIPECYGCYGHGHCNRPWTCSCNSGWTGSRCRSDINECSRTWKNSCSYKPGCINTDGSYRCTCASGFRLGPYRRRCNDINECRQHTHGCRHPASCQNTRGSYRCTCGSGYLLGSDQRTCKDVNECTTYQNGCSYQAGCQNTVGSYLCTCPHGYYLDGDRRTCRDINECDNSDCDHNCINYPGGYTCSCNNGYRANTNDFKRCIDIDECSEKLAGCTQICTNTAGGFRCSCNPGYYLGWDQKICNDIDECKGNEHGCQHSCENSLGSYKCRCRTGFELFSDGKNCTGKPCIPIYTPVNGKKNCSGYTTDHTCSFSCSIGYKEVGSHTRRCTASKLWSGKEMKCKAIHCPAPREPKDGFIYSPCNTRFNSECRGGCNNGFYINDTSKLACTVEGKWEPSQITCEEIKVCEPNPCKHGGKCTTLNPRQFSCNCSKTGYEGTNCEIGVIDIPDYPTLVAGIPVESLEFRSSPPDNYVILTPQGFGVEFNPNYLRFQQNSNTTQSLTMIVRYPGLHYVRYYLSGPSAAGYEIPQPNALFVETVKKTDPEVFTAYDNMEFPSGCHKLEIDKCPHSNVTISAYSTSSWLTLLVGFPATTEGQVSLSNGNLEIPYSLTGYSFIPKNPSSLDKDCAANPTVEHSLKELVQHRILTKSFLKVFRRSLPKWLDIKIRGNHSSTSLVETDLHAFYLTGRRLREEFIEGQPLSDDTFFSLLLSPDIDLVVNGDRVSFGLNDRNARFPLAIELCGRPPNNVILQPSPRNLDVINQLSVMKKLRDSGWNFKIFSLQIGMSPGKKGLTMVAKLTKNLTISQSVTSRVDFQGTVVANVDNLDTILEFPLDEKWVVELNGNIILTLEFEVHGKFIKLSLDMPQTRSNATFGGEDHESCFRVKKNNSNGLFLSKILKKDPFVNTELNKFVELDQTKVMSCFLSTLLYTKKQSIGSRYREKSSGVFLRFYGNLKFGALRFDNLNINLRIKNKRCSINTAKGTRSDVVAELSGSYWHADRMQKKLGMFEIDSDPVVNLHIGQKTASASGGSFSARVGVLGFKTRVNVNISHDGLRFRTRGKIHGWFDASALFKSQLTEWQDQRFTAAGVFELRETDDNIDSILEKELKIYSTELLRKLEARLDLSLRTEQQAKFRLNDAQGLREHSVMKMVEMTKEFRRVNESLDLAKKRLDDLFQLTGDYSEEIQRLKQELNELCELKQCPKVCRKGKSCEICWKYVFAEKMGMCPATCHYRELRLEFESRRITICPKQYCKWVFQSPFMYLLHLIGAISGTSLRLPPSVSLMVRGSTARFTRTTMTGFTLSSYSPTVLFVSRRRGYWKCKIVYELCMKEVYEFKFVLSPYDCESSCEKRYVKSSVKKSCCSTVSCASFEVNRTCITENKFCETARGKALEKISKVETNVAKILGNLDDARKNLSYWKMKREISFNKVRSASRVMKAYQDAVRSLEKAFNVTVENRKKTLKILEKPMMLRNLVNKFGRLRIRIKEIKFSVKVIPGRNTTLLPLNIMVTLDGNQEKQVSTVLDFTNFNRSLRSIAKEILGVYFGDVTRVSRMKRSTDNKNSTNDSKFFTLQTFHRLCSEFRNHKQTLYQAAMSLYNLSYENQQLLEEERQRERALFINDTAIFENFKVNHTKASELGLVVNYNAYSNVLANDPELSVAKHFQQEALKNEFDVVHLSSTLLFKNWLVTMENIFKELSDECSGFNDCLKYTIDSLLELVSDTNRPESEKLRREIRNLEEMYNNLTRQSDVSVGDAVLISWNILQTLKNMTGEEDVCARSPNITKHPTPFIQLSINKTLVLTCNATGDSLVYQWQLNGENLKHQTANILRIKNVSPLNSGNYSCDVSNHVAKASSIPTVVVIGAPPLIVRYPVRRLNVILSGYGTLICEAKMNSRNISYQWWFSQSKSGSFVPLANETFSHLSFAPVKSFHEGWYFCNVSNPFGNAITQKSFVKVLKYSLPVPIAKLSLTVISESSNNFSILYKDALAKALAFRLATPNKTLLPEKIIKDLIPTSCRHILRREDEFGRTDTCDWTFSIIGDNVTSSAEHIAPPQQIKKIVSSTSRLKRQIGKLGNYTNAGDVAFSLDNSSFFSPKNSLGIIGMSLFCPKGQFLVENDYKCADCPPGSYGTRINGVATCSNCPRGLYQSIPGQISCNKCPEGFVTADHGAIDQSQCEDENKFFLLFLLVNIYPGDVSVTANVSGKLEKFDLKPTRRALMSKKWKTKKTLILSAVDDITNRTVKINGQSVIRLQPTPKNRVRSLKVLIIKG